MAKSLLVVGNPLLDIVATVPPSLFTEYGLPVGGAVLANPDQLQLFDIVKVKADCSYLAGGCGQNSARIYQELSGKDGAVTYVGSVGDDDDGKAMKMLTAKQGINGIYKTCQGKRTGSCLVLVNQHERTLCTHLGACTELDMSFFDKHWDVVEQSNGIYTAGFVLSSSSESVKKLAQHCQSAGKIYAFNLSAEFLLHEYKQDLEEIIPMTNILFGNKDEYLAYAKINQLDWSGGVGDLACAVLRTLLKGPSNGKNRVKMVVITQGPDPVVVASTSKSEGIMRVACFPVANVPKEEIVDLNGAGDAFVGGFLFGIMNGKSVDISAEIGIWCSGNVIRHSGFQFDLSKCPYSLSRLQ